jgi:hypothetical protein
MKNIINSVPKFDSDVENKKISHTWQAILQFVRLDYFTEEEYKQSLSTVLLGLALDTYQEMARQGHILRQMLDTFAYLYGPRNTIEAGQKDVDNQKSQGTNQDSNEKVFMLGRQYQMPIKSDIMIGHQVQNVQISTQTDHYYQDKAVH